MKRFHALGVVLLGSSSCISFEVRWERVEEIEHVDADAGYRIDLPVGWARAGNLLTRDGAGLQAILFSDLQGLDEPDRGVLAPACQAQIVEELRKDHRVIAVESRELSDGQREIRVRFEGPSLTAFMGLLDLAKEVLFNVDGTWRYEVALITSADGRGFFFLYGAPPLVYFERDLLVFERLVASFEPL